MRYFILLVLGLGLSTNLLAQPIQAWQRNFNQQPYITGVPLGQLGVTHLRAGRSGQLVGVGAVSGRGAIDSTKLWVFNNAGATLHSRSYPLQNGSYAQSLPLNKGDVLLVGVGDSAAIPGTYNTSHFYVQADSLGNWRSRPHYLPPYGARNVFSKLLALPHYGALWAHTVNQLAFVPGQSTSLGLAQVVRFDSAQRIVWQRQYPGNTPNRDYMSVIDMASLLDGSYVIVGTKVRPFVPGPGFLVTSGWVQRIKANGDTIRFPDEYFGNISELWEPREVKPTADGGYVIVGRVYPDKYVPVFNCCPTNLQGFLAKFDSLGVQQWEQRLEGRNNPPQSPNNPFNRAIIDHVQVLANGHYLLTGDRTNAAGNTQVGYLAAYAPTATGAAPVWETYFDAGFYGRVGAQQVMAANGNFTLAGNDYSTFDGTTSGVLTRYANAGVPYVPDYCRRPPVPNGAAQLNAARDTLRLYGFGTGGPRFALVERWRWQLPGGVTYDGPFPPPTRVVPAPPPGTPVTLTLENNLGCAATQTLYPWGRPSAVQQARALADKAALFPNPAAQAATLRVPGLARGAGATAQVRDALGRAVGPAVALVWDAQAGTAVLPVAGLAAGVYVVQVQAGNLSFAKRLVVQP